MTDDSEFPAQRESTKILDAHYGHQQRHGRSSISERYGLSLQPSAKKIAFSPNPNNCSEFAIIEQIQS